MPEDLTYRLYTESDLPAYQQLYQKVFRQDFDQAMFRWKNCDNPLAGGKALVFVAQDGGATDGTAALVGAVSFFPVQVTHDNRKFLAVQRGDSMVDKNYRGRAIFLNLLTFAMQYLKEHGFVLIFAFCNQYSLPSSLRQGFYKLRKIDVRLRLFRLQGIVANKFRLLSPIAKGVDALLSLLPSPKSPSVTVAELPTYQEVPIGSASGAIQFDKQAAYLHWKYTDKPGGDYLHLTLKSGNEELGQAVIRLDQRGACRRATLMELWLDTPHMKTAAIRVLVQHLKAVYRCDYLLTWESLDLSLQRAFSANWFLRRSVPLYFIVKPLVTLPPAFLDANAWNLMQGDADTA